MKSGIYLIESILFPNKKYVGSSIDMDNRAKQHKRSLKGDYHNNIKLRNHINKYGIKDLVFTVLEYCDIDVLIEKETYYYDMLRPWFCLREPCNSNHGSVKSEETKKKLSIKAKEFWESQTDEYKRKNKERTKRVRRAECKIPKEYKLYWIENTFKTNIGQTYTVICTCKLCGESEEKEWTSARRLKNTCCIREENRMKPENHIYDTFVLPREYYKKPDHNYNSKMRNDNTSGYKGVTYDKAAKMFRARIKHKGKLYDAGRSHSAKDCAEFRNKYIIENNFPHVLSIID